VRKKASKMVGSKEPIVNRPREKQPDASTTAGLFAAYLAHVIEKRGVSVDALSESTGIHRATIFRWLRSQGEPSLSQIDSLAKALGYADAWALKPTKAFVDSRTK